MADATVDVVGVGNAIVDVVTRADDALVSRLGLRKGVMTLIDEAEARALHERMGPNIESSGGSAANTLAGIASLGGKGAYIGKVRNDRLGEAFRRDIRAVGVDDRVRRRAGGPPTARCLVFVTPDGERTMGTCLGISVELGPGDIDPEVVGSGRITYLEGYLFDKDAAKAAFVKAAEAAHAAGRKVALSLSDPFCVERHRASFQHLVSGHIDILFANEDEIVSLFETDSADEAIAAAQATCEVAAITRGVRGSRIAADGRVIAIEAEPVDRAVDTTGAGDLFAAGMLYGMTNGYPLEICGRIGSIAAGEIVGHYGARPETPLSALVRRRLS